MEILILTVFRLLIPLTILRWPIIVVLSSMYLDLQDFNYFTIRTEQDMANYQAWDKIMDIYYLAIAFYTSLSWKETLARKLSIFFFSLKRSQIMLDYLITFRPPLLYL